MYTIKGNSRDYHTKGSHLKHCKYIKPAHHQDPMALTLQKEAEPELLLLGLLPNTANIVQVLFST